MKRLTNKRMNTESTPLDGPTYAHVIQNRAPEASLIRPIRKNDVRNCDATTCCESLVTTHRSLQEACINTQALI